jgi:hypothetical protein
MSDFLYRVGFQRRGTARAAGRENMGFKGEFSPVEASPMDEE